MPGSTTNVDAININEAAAKEAAKEVEEAVKFRKIIEEQEVNNYNGKEYSVSRLWEAFGLLDVDRYDPWSLGMY